MQTPRKNHIGVIAALLAGVVLLVFVLGAAPETWRDIRRFMREAQLEEAVEFLRGFGNWTVVVILGLFIIEALLAPVPAWFLKIANGILFGPWLGGLVSLLGVALGSLSAFAVARWVGRRFVRRIIPDRFLDRVDQFSRSNGFAALLVLRLIPFTSSDVWSYVAGLSRLPVPHFLAATLLGDLPNLALFSFLGQSVLESPRYRWWLVVGGAVLLAAFLAYRFWQRLGANRSGQPAG